MMKRMVADLVAVGGNLTESFSVLLKRCILPDDEEGYLEISFLEETQGARHNLVKISWERLPARIPMRLHVRPLVIEV